MELGLAEHPDAVLNATHLLLRLPDRTERALPAGTSILSAYDQAEEELLILGAPGAGKSTLLLDLALHLIARAEADEMDEASRPLCIAAINTYRAEQVTPLVVCSHKAEYDMASARERLLLQNAAVVQALTQEQVANVIREGGPELAGLRDALIKSSTMRDLARTPLMLSVLILAYRGTTISDLPQQQVRLEERIWTDYVERMVRQMRVHNQIFFYAEHLQSDWLAGRQQRAYTWLVIHLPAILIGIVASVFIGLSAGLSLGMINGLSGLSLGLNAGWLLAISGGMLVWAMVGGLAVLRHYVLRWLLAHSHTFPWRARPFLEDAVLRILLRRVGGGYSFVHRLLLDHFAATDASTPAMLAVSEAENVTLHSPQEISNSQQVSELPGQ